MFSFIAFPALSILSMRVRPYLLLALLTYLWCATGIDRLASWSSVMNSEPAGAVIVMTEQARQLVIHHVGHQDRHEPNLEADVDAHAEDVAHTHADHVVTYCDDDSNQATPAKDLNLCQDTATAVPLPILLAFATDTPYHPPQLEQVKRRTTIEFVRTVRLLI